jgi:hypothetical protein
MKQTVIAGPIAGRQPEIEMNLAATRRPDRPDAEILKDRLVAEHK